MSLINNKSTKQAMESPDSGAISRKIEQFKESNNRKRVFGKLSHMVCMTSSSMASNQGGYQRIKRPDEYNIHDFIPLGKCFSYIIIYY